MRQWIIQAVAAAAITTSLGASDALASRELMWLFQDTGHGASSDQTAVALRSGLAWPVIFSGDGDAFGLFATEDFSGNHWQPIGGGLPLNGPVIAKSSSDGRILAYSPWNSSVVVGSPSGGFTLHNAQAGTFGPDGSLTLASSFSIPTGGAPIIDMAVASDGTLGAIADNGRYYENRFGQWQSLDFDDFGPQVWGDQARLTFDAQSRPHISAVSSGDVYTFHFSTAAGEWVTTEHGFTEADFIPIASTTLNGGEVGISWIENGTLKYSLFDGTGTWTQSAVTTGFMEPWQGLGLAFDWDGLPVISFERNGGYWLAYDPVPVPEPTSLALLGIGGLMLMRRRRTAA
ncbi:MAG: PEP-CTERM sorting domain-containing protein [Phycisphaeraceae bacterium]